MSRTAILLTAACAVIAPGLAGSAKAQALTLTTSYGFTGMPDGANPESTLIPFRGLFYGTTAGGGANNHGAIYSFNPVSGVVAVVYSFSGGTADGAAPISPLAIHNGGFYGTTSAGGTAGDGTIYSFDPTAQTETVLHSFTGPDGNSPQGAIVVVGSVIYGGTNSGGTSRFDGVLYKFGLNSHTLTVLHSFTDGADGEAAGSGLYNDGGILYGTTLAGGNTNDGTVFSIDTSTNTFKSLFSFTAKTTGSSPGGLLVRKTQLYGVTYGGGPSGNGSVFKFSTTTNKARSLYYFTAGNDGALPSGTPVFHNGLLYGTTTAGGAADHGTLYSLVPKTGAETILHTFSGGNDGTYPTSLFNSRYGILGSTVFAGAGNDGTLFTVK